jgi:hypothetical protein
VPAWNRPETPERPECVAELQAASDAATAYREATEEIVRQRQQEQARLDGDLFRLQARRHQADAAIRDLISLWRSNRELFNIAKPEPEPERPVFSVNSEALVAQQRAREAAEKAEKDKPQVGLKVFTNH